MDPRPAIDRLLRRLPVWPIYAGSTAHALWRFAEAAAGRMGPNPVEALEHAYGKAALWLLVAGLAVTPLRRLARINLYRFRRALGLSCFLFVVLHLVVWAVLDVQSAARVWADIVKRPYITIGMSAFALLVPLAATSNEFSLRRLGPAWRRLHRLVYPAAVLAGLHYVWLAKGFQIEPLVYLALILGLVALRLPGVSPLARGVR
ncbi:MAG: sulfoxide reductase heme-binding subunit YedZ [Roseovarius sp.]